MRAQTLLVEPVERLDRTGDRIPERVFAEHQRAHDVVGIDLSPGLVEVVEDLLADDSFLDVDLTETRRANDAPGAAFSPT